MIDSKRENRSKENTAIIDSIEDPPLLLIGTGRGRHIRWITASLIASIVGIAADLILGYVTPGSIGAGGIIQVGWADVALWRPAASMLMVSVAFPVYLLGFRVLFEKLREALPKTAQTFWVLALASSCGGVIVHAFFCYPQYVYAYLSQRGDSQTAFEVSEGLLWMLVPSLLIFMPLMAAALLVLIGAFGSGKTGYPRVTAAIGPLSVAAVLSLMRVAFPESALVLGLTTSSVHIGLLLVFGIMLVWELRAAPRFTFQKISV